MRFLIMQQTQNVLVLMLGTFQRFRKQIIYSQCYLGENHFENSISHIGPIIFYSELSSSRKCPQSEAML